MLQCATRDDTNLLRSNKPVIALLVKFIMVALPSLANAAIGGAACQNNYDRDCAYNGHCMQMKCVCNPQWHGPHCESLRLLPASKTTGFGSPHHHGSSTLLSTWGGSVLYDENDRAWHMYASQMVNECGIDYWEPNSRVVHAVSMSSRPEGPYTFDSVVVEPFAHEPNAVKSPDGDWVLYFTMRHPPGWQANCSSNNSSSMKELGGSRHDDDNEPPSRHSYMIHSKSPYGPWSDPQLVLQANYSYWGGRKTLVDTNLAVIISLSGEAIGIWRKCENWPNTSCEDYCCTIPHVLRADDWKDASTYRVDSNQAIFPGLTPHGSEDPMLWLDDKRPNVIHAVLHDEQDPAWPRMTPRGRHAFSDDGGITWVYAKENAYNGTVLWRDGKTTQLYKRERPHMILSPAGEPLAITNGIQESAATDRSWTMVQPIQQQRLDANVEIMVH